MAAKDPSQAIALTKAWVPMEAGRGDRRRSPAKPLPPTQYPVFDARGHVCEPLCALSRLGLEDGPPATEEPNGGA